LLNKIQWLTKYYKKSPFCIANWWLFFLYMRK
jgi:hypothetical protein